MIEVSGVWHPIFGEPTLYFAGHPMVPKLAQVFKSSSREFSLSGQTAKHVEARRKAGSAGGRLRADAVGELEAFLTPGL